METEHIVEQILAFVRQNFRSDDPAGSMTAARMGNLIRSRFGNLAQRSGYPKLKDLLEELERRGSIRLGPNSKKALSIWIEGPTSDLALPTPPAGAGRKPSGPYRPLRQPLWHAFVAAAPEGRRFMHRLSGEICLGASSSPHAQDEWVEIPFLSESEDREAARSFLEGEGLAIEGALSQALGATRWFAELPRVIPVHLAGAWKRRRTGRVVELAERWRRENHLAEQLVYDDRLSNRYDEREDRARDIRSLLVEAVQRMTTEEMLALAIPARYLVSVLRPDLTTK